MTPAEVRARCKENLYFFAKVILGYKDFSPNLHQDLCRFLQTAGTRKLILLPRAHFKSSACTIAYSIWRVINNPDIRILINSNTANNAERFLREIGANFTNNKLFMEIFPELVPDMTKKTTKWTSTEMTVNREASYGEATFTGMGMSGAMTGKHFDLIINDDLIDERINFEGDLIEKVITWYKYSEGLFVSPSQSECIVVGTRYHFSDLYQHILDNESDVYKVYHRKAIENGKPIFPERFSLAALEGIKAKQGPVVFANQYMNDPIDTASVKFRREHLNIIPDHLVPPGVLRFMLNDTIGERKADQKGDLFALTCWGVDPQFDSVGLNNIYLLDLACGSLDIEASVQAAVSMFARHRPTAYGIEKVGQSTFGIHIQNAVRMRGGYIHYEDLSPKGRKKEARIWGLLPYALNNKIFVTESVYNSEGFKEFLYEWERFPKVSRDDVLDSSAYVLDMIDKYRGSFDYLDADEYEPSVVQQRNRITGY